MDSRNCVIEKTQTRKCAVGGFMKLNYQKILDQTIASLQTNNVVPSLLLHSCCAPCSSYCLEYLSQFFRITVYYYNPNIYPITEYKKRVEEQKRLISCLPVTFPISFLEARYDANEFFSVTKGMEDVPEGGERCFICYELRLKETAKMAKEQGFDYFTTTLSISPLKKADILNEIGKHLEQEYEVSYLLSDFKKRNGYKRSIELSKAYELYRQDFCGCVYSHRQ